MKSFSEYVLGLTEIFLKLQAPSSNYQLPVISRLKIMASMDIAERRLPQDGRIKLRVGGEPIDFRVSSLPTLFGEKIVFKTFGSVQFAIGSY